MITTNLKTWAVIFPDGRMVIDPRFHTPQDAWEIALGWPTDAEIAEAELMGAFAVEVRISYDRI